jgi:PKD repeat protein
VIGASQDGLKAASWLPGQTTTFANGLIAGQYHAPIADYIFPEQLPGQAPIPENNFNTMPFLAQGGYTSSAGTLVGQLNPWPSNITPLAACIGAVANAGGPYTVASGGSVTLNGTSTGDLPIAFAWTATAGSFSNAALPNPVYTAPVGPATPTLTLTATNCGGTVVSTSTTTVTVSAPAAPTVTAPTAVSVFSGAAGSFAVSGSDPNVPALTPLTFTETQAGAPALTGLTATSTGATTANVTFTAPVLPVGQVTPATVTVTTTARNTAGVSSAGASTVVTVNPLVDNVIIQTAIYRTSARRLIVTATSSVISPNVVLKLQPYVATDGTTYNPDPAAGGVGNVFTNAGGGNYTLTINAVPAPACGNPAGYATPCPTRPLQVKSNLNGASVFTALTQIRQ